MNTTQVFIKNSQVNVIAPMKRITKVVLNKIQSLGAKTVLVRDSSNSEAELLQVDQIQPVSSAVQSSQSRDYEEIFYQRIGRGVRICQS